MAASLFADHDVKHRDEVEAQETLFELLDPRVVFVLVHAVLHVQLISARSRTSLLVW